MKGLELGPGVGGPTGFCTPLQGACVSRFSRVRLFATLWTVALQAPLSMGILQARMLKWVAMPSSNLFNSYLLIFF